MRWGLDRRGSNGFILRAGRRKQTLGWEDIPAATDLLFNSIRTPKSG